VTIAFYGHGRGQPYACFSNFSPHGFELDGERWPTSEHYFQAQKFLDPAQAEAVRTAPTPAAAKRLGRSRRHPLRPDWERVKDDVMRRAVLAKVESHPDIQAVLLGTGDEPIVETAPRDYYWGSGATGTGKNRLGQILVEVRTHLRERGEQPERGEAAGHGS
jgi:hypothetical protein